MHSLEKITKLIKELKGFTLVESMITSAIVATVVVGYLGTTIVMQQTTQGIYEETIALQDANRVIEQMRNSAATGTFPSNVTGSFNGSVTGYSSLPSGNTETVTVAYVSASANPLDATVTVSYLANAKRSTSLSMRTYITQRT